MLYVWFLHSYNRLYKRVMPFCETFSIGSTLTHRGTHSRWRSWEGAGHGVGEGKEATYGTCSSRGWAYPPVLVLRPSNGRLVAAGIAASA
jgi:hypothetical protein